MRNPMPTCHLPGTDSYSVFKCLLQSQSDQTRFPPRGLAIWKALSYVSCDLDIHNADEDGEASDHISQNCESSPLRSGNNS